MISVHQNHVHTALHCCILYAYECNRKSFPNIEKTFSTKRYNHFVQCLRPDSSKPRKMIGPFCTPQSRLIVVGMRRSNYTYTWGLNWYVQVTDCDKNAAGYCMHTASYIRTYVRTCVHPSDVNSEAYRYSYIVL